MRPILLLELNEIPWRVWDLYLSKPGFDGIKTFFNEANQWTTIAQDKGELSPWITWPTLHRGINNEEHGIQNLGQDVSTFKGEPIWETYLKAGKSVGVCGSLQSWPPKEPGEGGFYLPDTFAPSPECFPKSHQPLVEFNLNMVRKNARVVKKSSLNIFDAVKLGVSLPRFGIKVKTLARIAQQLIRERRNKLAVQRRPIFQTILFWDVFKSLYSAKNPPAFSTFFTNHVAGVMHRFWHLSFPEDFKPEDKIPTADPHLMDFAMKVTDQILKDAMKLKDECPELIVVAASSMGQSKITYENHSGFESVITDTQKFVTALGFTTSEIEPLLAMVPQTSYKVTDSKVRDRFTESINSLRTVSGFQPFEWDQRGTTLTLTLNTAPISDLTEEFIYSGPDGRRLSWLELGIDHLQVDAGTAYHIPEGPLAFWGNGFESSRDRKQIAATEVKELLLSYSGLKVQPEPQSSFNGESTISP